MSSLGSRASDARAASRGCASTTSSVLALAVLQDRHQHGPLALDVHHVGLRRVAVAHVGDVAHVDRRAVDGLDRQVADLVDELGARS